jgi:hypothetical protein
MRTTPAGMREAQQKQRQQRTQRTSAVDVLLVVVGELEDEVSVLELGVKPRVAIETEHRFSCPYFTCRNHVHVCIPAGVQVRRWHLPTLSIRALHPSWATGHRRGWRMAIEQGERETMTDAGCKSSTNCRTSPNIRPPGTLPGSTGRASCSGAARAGVRGNSDPGPRTRFVIVYYLSSCNPV